MFISPWESVQKCELGAGQSINLTDNIGEVKKLISVKVSWCAGSAPTTNEDLVITLQPHFGPDYYMPLKRIDLSKGLDRTDKYIYQPDKDIVIGPRDHVNVVYPNTDDLEMTVMISFIAA